MSRALQLAAKGRGLVEPNPLVGCVIAVGPRVVGEGFHERFGGPHAEVTALGTTGDIALANATMYVTLEPCSHHGKTPPCADAIIQSGVGRVVIAHVDPFPDVSGRGIERLRDHKIQVEVGLLQAEALRLNSPYLKLVRHNRPWIIAKWAMSMDGKIATRQRHSKWISSAPSREIVHRLRGRVDAIMIGRGTADADDPLLTARPAGPRVATRIVVDSLARLRTGSRLVQTARKVPVIVSVGPDAPAERCRGLASAGCEILKSSASSRHEHLEELLHLLGSRRMTNVLVEGGAHLLGALLDGHLVDEAHVFVAPLLFGGATAVGATAGRGVATVVEAARLDDPVLDTSTGDIYVHGPVVYAAGDEDSDTPD